jgi:hypothetical protein
VMQVLIFFSSPFFLGLVDHPSIRALSPEAKSAHTLTYQVSAP